MVMRAGAVYDALVAAQVPEDKAKAAAEEIAMVNRDQFDLRGEFEKIRGEFSVVKWMMGTMIILQLGTVGTIVSFPINHLSFR